MREKIISFRSQASKQKKFIFFTIMPKNIHHLTILSDSNKKHKLQVGNIKKQSHAWVNYDGLIIDPTKSQFPGIEHKDYFEDIDWEKEL